MIHPTNRRRFLKCLAAAPLFSSPWLTGLRSETSTSNRLPTPPLSAWPVPLIVDTHQHLWDTQRFNIPWLRGAAEQIRPSHLTPEYLAATQGLPPFKAVYMEIDVSPDQKVAEAEFVASLCASPQHPTSAAVIGGAPASDTFEGYIRPYHRHPYVRGVRQVLHGGNTPAGYCLQPSFVRGIQLLGSLDLSFDLCMRPEELGDGAELAKRCPDTRFIVDHCGNADPKAFSPATLHPSHHPEKWKKGLSALADRPNTVCKISGIVARVNPDSWGPEDLAPIVEFCLSVFGPDRVIFGSDWPVCKLGASLHDWVVALHQITQNWCPTTQSNLWYQNARRLYRV